MMPRPLAAALFVASSVSFSVASTIGFVAVTPAAFAATPGQSAPEIALPATDGKSVKLSEHKGKWVVLEWVNPGCPYVRKHYDSKNMQSLQKDYGAKDVVWIAVNSTNPSHVDYLKPAAMGEWMKTEGGTPRATLMDEKGVAGRAYGARTTPQMFIIDPKGHVVYNGAIDDKRSANPADVKTAKNHVRAAMDESLAGKPVTTASTTPYGCTVKY